MLLQDREHAAEQELLDAAETHQLEMDSIKRQLADASRQHAVEAQQGAELQLKLTKVSSFVMSLLLHRSWQGAARSSVWALSVLDSLGMGPCCFHVCIWYSLHVCVIVRNLTLSAGSLMTESSAG